MHAPGWRNRPHVREMCFQRGPISGRAASSQQIRIAFPCISGAWSLSRCPRPCHPNSTWAPHPSNNTHREQQDGQPDDRANLPHAAHSRRTQVDRGKTEEVDADHHPALPPGGNAPTPAIRLARKPGLFLGERHRDVAKRQGQFTLQASTHRMHVSQRAALGLLKADKLWRLYSGLRADLHQPR